MLKCSQKTQKLPSVFQSRCRLAGHQLSFICLIVFVVAANTLQAQTRIDDASFGPRLVCIPEVSTAELPAFIVRGGSLEVEQYQIQVVGYGEPQPLDLAGGLASFLSNTGIFVFWPDNKFVLVRADKSTIAGSCVPLADLLNEVEQDFLKELAVQNALERLSCESSTEGLSQTCSVRLDEVRARLASALARIAELESENALLSTLLDQADADD
ncbi:hypothetical protein [Marivivens marinus]|uniref:hypothetical protein n=1 Tax=Marivivens marinus TaxID=3110173 RepID=UPI003B84673E